MGLSWISCSDVAATLTSQRVWRNNYCVRKPRRGAVFLKDEHFLHNLWRERRGERERCCWVLIAVTGCHSCFSCSGLTSSLQPQKCRAAHDASGYCKADELLKWLIMISDALSIMSREQDFNLTANITLQLLRPIKCVFHTPFVIWVGYY